MTTLGMTMLVLLLLLPLATCLGDGERSPWDSLLRALRSDPQACEPTISGGEMICRDEVCASTGCNCGYNIAKAHCYCACP
uniref:Conotoxin Cl10.1 n=1 Tax=Californiconus californicus TaxID=1736779 RepID=CUM1_CONCL